MMFWKNRHLILSAYYSAWGPVRLSPPGPVKRRLPVFPFLYFPGGISYSFLNILLKCSTFSNPTRLLISAMLIFVFFKRMAAF